MRLVMPDDSVIPLRRYGLRRVIFAHSERNSFAEAPTVLLAPFVILLAPGRDGDKAAVFFESVGCKLVRGSTLHSGTTGLRQLIRVLRAHEGPAAISVDGPVGPLGAVKPGIFSCAFHTGRPIIATAAAARPCLVFRRSWSQIILPLPGARVVIAVAADLDVNGPLNPPLLERLTNELAARLDRAQRRAETTLQTKPE